MRHGIHIHSQILAVWIIDERWMCVLSKTRMRKLLFKCSASKPTYIKSAKLT